MREILGLIIAAAILVGLPAMLIWAAVDHVRNGRKRERRGGSGGAPIGSALMELDRLVARPSVEHVVEAENRVLRNEDDAGDPPAKPPAQ